MSISAATLEKLMAAGLSGEALLDVVRSIEADNVKPRSNNAIRQQRFRDKKRYESNVTNNAENNVTESPPPPNDIYSNPPPLTPSAKADDPLSDFSDRVVEVWNRETSGTPLPQARKMTPDRRKHLRSRVKEHGEDAVFQAIRNMCASDFHSGRDGKWTEGNLGWLLKSPENFQKMLERQSAPPKASQPIDPGVYDRLRAKGFDMSSSTASGPVPRSESTGPPRTVAQVVQGMGRA